MSRDEALKILMKESETSDLVRKVDELTEKVDLLLSVIVVRQKEACAAAGITEATARNKALAGEFEVLTPDGSRLNFLQLKEVANLKKRTKTKRKIGFDRAKPRL